jgi:hypothetical protein
LTDCGGGFFQIEVSCVVITADCAGAEEFFTSCEVVKLAKGTRWKGVWFFALLCGSGFCCLMLLSIGLFLSNLILLTLFLFGENF